MTMKSLFEAFRRSAAVLMTVGMLTLTFALILTGCPNPSADGAVSGGDTRATLAAGPAVSAAASAVTASVTFTGASGLTLTAADFAVSAGGAITTVGVASGTATVSVGFAANASTSAKTYIVSIAAGSSIIKGNTTVAINQA
ncbi:MAG: hypothetical protein LBS82_02295, partial [Spirochaetaceae bacterium]|nr:hypothetical protein [Spirochaetaceae bacterium]